jgi:hypothetical protein
VLVTTVVPCVFLVLMVLSSAQAVGYADTPDPAEEVLEGVEMDQHWRISPRIRRTRPGGSPPRRRSKTAPRETCSATAR